MVVAFPSSLVDAEPSGVILALDGDFRGESFTLAISDPQIVSAVSKYESAEIGVEAMLKVAAGAVLATASDFDVHAVRKELDRAVDRAADALGALHEQVNATVGDE